ncbi:RDD family protein [Streptomyces microflavus]|uniref:RDD family protein n=1 Tax=Streptomyces microflavus TaxID=1919 RepID=A0A7H8MK30_STRMI|nr:MULTISPECIES: RDD family protein [Streptomyces]MBW3358303.1 RDD family protein [Streptomyces sp. 09ZI22]MEE1728709.1 RDD family protein [Streptomyces sp. BE282]QKW42897.1 RDD family protein [Streptomyces microflavus]QQZ53951.1 RDD family protein [Streptomyces microflavus]QTA31890.1 RDD family protein [Streptomyces sp. CA-256286]
MRSVWRLFLYNAGVFVACLLIFYAVWFWGIPFVPSKGSDGSDQRLSIATMVISFAVMGCSLLPFREFLRSNSPRSANANSGGGAGAPTATAPAVGVNAGNTVTVLPVSGRVPRLLDRYMANLLDGFLPVFMALPVVAAYLIASWAASERQGVSLNEYTPPVWLTASCLVPVLAMLLGGMSIEFVTGTSIGKYAMGMRVKRIDGRKIRLRDAFSRTVCKYILALVGIATFFGGLLLVVLWRMDARRRFLWDLVAGTQVVATR